MKSVFNKSVLTLSLLLGSAYAQAQANPDAANQPAPPESQASPFSANVTLATQYVSRGFQQTWGEPAVQGGFDYAHDSGLFAGTWMSSVSSKLIESGTVEWDLYAGYAGEAGDIGYSATVYYYLYPGAEIANGNIKYDYGELSLGVTYKMLSAKYNYTYTKDFFGFTDARGAGYLDLGAEIDLGSAYTLQLHYGIARVRNWSDYNWKDYKIGLSKSFDGGWTVTGALTKGSGATSAYRDYPATTANSAGEVDTSNPLKRNIVLSVTKAF